MSFSPIAPVFELEQRSEMTPMQRWAESLQDVPQTQSLPQFSPLPASQAPGGNLMSQLGTLLQTLVPLLQQLVFSLSQQHAPLLNSLSGAPPLGGPSSLGAPQPMSMAPPPPVPAPQPSFAPPATSPSVAPSPVTSAEPTPAPAAAPTAAPAPVSSTQLPAAHSVKEAASRTQPRFMPVLRGDEQQKDSQIKTQADFGRAADEVAREYGLDPNLFRAQLQSESNAFKQDFRKSMQAEGDLGRASENNTSIGLGQISRKFLDGREWADGASGNARVGSQVVTTDQYMNSPTVQLRMAASNLSQRIADHGGLEQGLAYYVSGNPDPGNSHAKQYLENIERAMNDPAVIGR
jgi:hypothetical protein